jgi:dTDP-4-amino-4,6-dideoxygalactose transaminase
MTNPTTEIRSIPVARPSLGAEEEQALTAALRSGWISQGPKVAEFERAFADYVGARCAVAVSSCTTALHLALLAVGIKRGDEVLCPSLSFIATANAITYAGAVPVFVDVDCTTFNLDPNCIEDAITPRTRAILLVHQVGLAAALDEICEVARKHSLMVIEDAACAVGAEYHGLKIGLPHTAVACFSFHPRKVLTTGEGGMITTGDEKLAARMRRLRQHGMSVSDLARHSSNKVAAESYDEVGFNYRMTDLQAALGCVQLRRLDEMLAKRREMARLYSEKLSDVPWLIPPQEPAEVRHNYQSYMVRLKSGAPISRDELMQRLLDRGIATRRGIMAIHREAPYKGDWDKFLPNTNLITDTAIILPLFHEMTADDVNYVVECIAEIDA